MAQEAPSREQLIARANDIRRGAEATPQEAFALAQSLAELRALDVARRLARHVSEDRRLPPELALEARQKWALWTSKNPDGPDDSKHDEALSILDGIALLPRGKSLAETDDPETLGIAGGICKRRWMVDGQVESLELSLRYYRRGAARGVLADNGYTAINAAFVHDLLASQAGKDSPTDAARELRTRILDELLPLQEVPAAPGKPPRNELRWFQETIAEAYFGLERFEQARERLLRVAWKAVESWELETTARQFAWLARLLDPAARSAEDFERSPPWKVLHEAFGSYSRNGAGSLFAGKLGLALSGGGFRASLFHIGVLAGLAELDLLRHVEALSCVSGGSIVGAHYYLEARKLLQEHEDGNILREEYVRLVERLAGDFLAGVQANLRTRVASSIKSNLKMMLVPGYSRTTRLGELYEEHLYARIQDQDAQGRRERRLRLLRVRPKGDEGCNPVYDNWRRRDKVPILILNATTVNTGHNWQFTASWMGEPPTRIESKVDGNYRLRRMYLESEAPARHKDLHIGQAVAASSCVPGLFTPLELRDLYPGITVRLVDGGVHDNQGVFGLLDSNCNVLIVSDASGQMSTLDRPSDAPLGTLLRSSSMSMARVRATTFRELEFRRKSGHLKGLLYLHLKEELPVGARDWVDCDNPKEFDEEECKRLQQDVTSYNVLKSVQEQLAGIRTDLDSFSEQEAYALMASGCLMVRTKLADAIHGFATSPERHSWPFLAIEPALRRSSDRDAQRLRRLLDVARHGAFKVWRLSRPLVVLAAVLGLAALSGLAWMAWSWRGAPFLSERGLAAAASTTALTAIAGTLGLGLVVRLVRYRKTLYQILVGLGLSLLGPLLAWTHLLVFDRRFLALGRLRKGRGVPPLDPR